MTTKDFYENVQKENQKNHKEVAHRFLANEQLKAKITKSAGVLSFSSIILDDGQYLTAEDLDSFHVQPGIIFTRINSGSVKISATN